MFSFEQHLYSKQKHGLPLGKRILFSAQPSGASQHRVGPKAFLGTGDFSKKLTKVAFQGLFWCFVVVFLMVL